MFDILIKNGNIIDGTGKKMFKGDIGVKDEKISQIGNLANERGEVTINAQGKIVCPGFIDVNNHSDTYWQIFFNPRLESLVHQGITTIVGGNCGSSLAPLANAANIASIQKWLDLNRINVNWLSMREFMEKVEEKKLAVNFATLVGHGTLRRGILKDQMRAPDEKELEFMEKKLKSSLKAGALGMSSGLVYTHARTASLAELVKLCKLIKKYDRIYVTHIREERKEIIESVREALRVAEESNVKLHISHLKVMEEKNWKFMDEALFLIGQARERGVDVTFDVYPYTNTGTVMYTLLPNWATDGGRKMMLNRLRDPLLREKVVAEMEASGFDFGRIYIASSGLNKTLTRRKISEIAKAQEKSPAAAAVDILVASEGRVITSMEVLNQENVKKAVENEASIIATNGSGYNLEHVKSGEMVHPRSFGTFPKVLAKYVREQKILSWEAAIKKMTSLPAEKFSIKKRGRLAEDCFADIAIIDSEKINDLATVENPYQYSQGIDYVLVNGKIVLQGGEQTEVRAGEIIKAD